MKMFVAGVERIEGLSKASQTPFDMCNVHGLVAIERMKNAKITITGAGFKQMDLPLLPDALPSFNAYADKFPCWLELVTEPVPRNGKFETTVVGIAPIAKAA